MPSGSGVSLKVWEWGERLPQGKWNDMGKKWWLEAGQAETTVALSAIYYDK